MREIVSDDFYEFTKQYDMDREHHLVGDVDYHLLSDDKPYDGLRSHREALKVVFDKLEKRDLEDQRKAREMFGDRIADQIHPWIYDIDKAQSKYLDPQEFFYCPNIVKTDYYGGACCWSIYDKAMNRYVVMLVSATD